MAKYSFKESQAFHLRLILSVIPVQDLGEVAGNLFKAVTMRRKMTQYLEEVNKEFMGKAKKAAEIREKFGNDLAEFKKELDTKFSEKEAKLLEGLKNEEKETKKAEVTKDLMSEKEKEGKIYEDEINEKYKEEIKEFGLRGIIYSYKVEGRPQMFETFEYEKPEEEKMVEIELEEASDRNQNEFVKSRFEKHAVNILPIENIIVPIGEVFGLA